MSTTNNKRKADRIQKQLAFEAQLIAVYAENAELLADHELQEVINRFAARFLESGRG